MAKSFELCGESNLVPRFRNWIARASARSSPKIEKTGTLEGRGISVHFGGVAALQEVTISVNQKGIIGLIGPNGAGKTTLVNVLTGFQRPDTGHVVVNGEDVTGRAPHRIVRAGVARTFQSVRLFAELSVTENVEASAAAMGLNRQRARARAAGIINWMGLGSRAEVRAGALPYGEERRVGMARALAVEPAFLLLDEPAAGLNESECNEMVETIARIPAAFNCGVLLIEHNMPVIMGVCQTLHVLDGGRTIAIGPMQQVRDDPEVIRAYLGSKRGRRRAVARR